MFSRRRFYSLIGANLLIPIAVLVFATGFFPYKTFIPGRASFERSEHGIDKRPPPFDKVIFMVVDALRRLGAHLSISYEVDVGSDFVYSQESGFQFTQG